MRGEKKKKTLGNSCFLALVLCFILSAETQGRHQNMQPAARAAPRPVPQPSPCKPVLHGCQ
ncbi:hypothetical protein ACRRTK_007525 [Alexandromys fortis]